MRILFVDAGNYSRSPAAEVVTRALVADRDLADRITVSSAGLKDKHVGGPPDPRTSAVCSEHGLDLSGFVCQQIKAADFHDFDLILAMDRENLAALAERRPHGSRATLGLFLDAAGGGEVPDPYFGGPEGFSGMMELIGRGAEALISQIERGLASPSPVHDLNLTELRPSFVTHLECSMTGEHYEADRLHNLSRVGRPLLVRYDLDGVKRVLTKEKLASRPTDLWRWRELLPVRRTEDIVSLGEVMTPIVPLPRLAARHGAETLLVKDEGRLPTGSFKARGLVMAVSMAKALGVRHIAMPTNGNAGAALSAYASKAGIRTTIFCPEDTPEVNVSEIALQGADVWRVNGLIDDCGRIVGEGKEKVGWFDVSTLKEPYRIEGKKTMGLELAEQLGWELPDVIFYPTGGGTGLIGMWKAFDELERIGFIGSKRPRMVAVQAEGCAPMVKAFEDGVEHAPRWENAHTIASGIRVPQAVGDFLILRAVRESDGFAVAVSDEAIERGLAEVAAEEGFLLCPEGAATYAAWQKSLVEGRIGRGDRVVLFNCATGLKYPLPPARQWLDRTKPIDWSRF